MLYKRFSIQILLLATFLLVGVQSFAQPNVGEGKQLFKDNCAQCHARNMKSDLTGPALGGMEERWADYPREDLYTWVRNSQKMIADGHPYALELWAKWKPTVMNQFPNLTDDQIESIILYVNDEYNKVDEVVVNGGTAGGATGSEPTNWSFYYVIVGVLALLALILGRLIILLNHQADQKEGTSLGEPKSVLSQVFSPSVIAFIIFILVLLFGHTVVNNAIDLGRQKGYQPQQPIKFSHATHAGEQQIDCQYCHDGARRSKHSVIPATNTCMNCHAAIKVGSTYGTEELTKIYASAGWNPNTGQYFASNVSEDDKNKAYKKWFKDEYVKANADATEKRINSAVDKQLANIQEFMGRPIEWTKIHNLPDHVYFNHAQHVSVGKVECQTCHGPVETMEVLEQHAPLSMGWCVNCHRETEVKFADNPYYNEDFYKAYHTEIKNGSRTAVTVEEIGGLECQKCHY